jgi:hypothetical protein
MSKLHPNEFNQILKQTASRKPGVEGREYF